MNRRVAFALGSLLVLSILLLGITHFYSFTVDDAFISFRYAENLAGGHGLVYNSGERVEGYTNFLWTLMLAGLVRLDFPIVPAAKVLGILFAIATALLLVETSTRFLENAGWIYIVPALLLVTNPSVSIYAVSGLETVAFGFILLLTFRLLVWESSTNRTIGYSSVSLLILTLLRPEGFLFFALAAVLKAYSLRSLRKGFAWALPYLVMCCGYLIWKSWYYGDILPNTYYAKTGRGLQQILGGIFYTYSYVKNNGGVMLLFLLLLAALQLNTGSRVRNGLVGWLIASVGCWFLYNIYKGHDPLPGFRFFVLVLPIPLLLIAKGLYILRDALSNLLSQSSRAHLMASSTCVAIVGFFIVQNLTVGYLTTTRRPQMREYQVQIAEMDANHEFAPMGRELRRVAPEGAVIAVIDAGAIPYYSKLRAIDRWGLTDPHISREKRRGALGEKFDAEYILRKRPEYIQTKMYRSRLAKLSKIASPSIEDFDWPGDYYLYGDSIFVANYVMCGQPVLNGVFVRRDLVRSTKVTSS